MMQFFQTTLSFPAKFILLLLCGLVLQACSPTEPPELAVSDFWAAALSEDKPAITALVYPANFKLSDFETARYHELFNHAMIGEASITKRRARVETHLQGHFQDLDFDTIAVVHERRWRVDYAATIDEMIAALLSSTVTDMGTDMQSDIKILGESLDEAILEDWRNLDRALNED